MFKKLLTLACCAALCLGPLGAAQAQQSPALQAQQGFGIKVGELLKAGRIADPDALARSALAEAERSGPDSQPVVIALVTISSVQLKRLDTASAEASWNGPTASANRCAEAPRGSVLGAAGRSALRRRITASLLAPSIPQIGARRWQKVKRASRSGAFRYQGGIDVPKTEASRPPAGCHRPILEQSPGLAGASGPTWPSRPGPYCSGSLSHPAPRS